MSNAPQTPQRPLPGAYYATPATSRAGPRGALFPQQNGLLPQGRGSSQLSLPAGKIPPATTAEEIFAEVNFASRTINEKLEIDARFPELDNYIGRK